MQTVKIKHRKRTRLINADYNDTSTVFLTLCTEGRRCILSYIVDDDHLDCPKVELTCYGQIVDKYIRQLNDFYDNLVVENYVIMPNHVHILMWIKGDENEALDTRVSTVQNSVPSKFVSTLKRFCNKECGVNIWQYRSYDHIIRDQYDYDKHFKYIDDNPISWVCDELYVEG